VNSNDFPTNVFVAPHNVQPTPTFTVTTSTSDVMDSVETATYLGITTNNLRQMVFKKKLVPSGKNGRRLLFNRGDVIACAESRNK